MMAPPRSAAAMPADSWPRCWSAYSAKYARRATSCSGAKIPKTPHSSRGPSRRGRSVGEDMGEPAARVAAGAATTRAAGAPPTGPDPHRPGSADLDAGLVERALEELRAGARPDRQGVGVRDRPDLRGLRGGGPVDDDLDGRVGLDALDRVPLAVVDRRAGRHLAVAGRAVEPARRLARGLVLHLPLAARGRVEALADDVPVGLGRGR